MKFRVERRQEVNLDLTPLIDVVFLLIIFFMVATNFTKQSEIKINLPEASATITPEEIKQIEVTIDKQGQFYVNEKSLDQQNREALKKTIQSMITSEEKSIADLAYVIKADGRTEHKKVVAAMDVANQLGFSRITFVTICTENSK